MSHTSRAIRQLIKAIGSDTKGVRSIALAGSFGAVIGVGVALAAAATVLLPEAEARAARRTETRVNDRVEKAAEMGYRQGIMDLVEGRIKLEQEVERAFILVRRSGNRVDRFPIDPEQRGQLRKEGWDLDRSEFVTSAHQ